MPSKLLALIAEHQVLRHACALLLCCVPIAYVLPAVLSPLRALPGPFLARFTRFWYLRRILRREFHTENIQLHERYGPVVRIAPNEFSIDDPAAMKTIYGLATQFTKSPWYYASGGPDPNHNDLFTQRDSKKHAALRRKVANLYSTSNLLRMEDTVADCVDRFIDRCHEIAGTGRKIDMRYWFQCYALDVIGAITVAKPFGLLDCMKDHMDMFPALHGYLRYCAAVGVFAEWHPVASVINDKFGPKGFANMAKFSIEQVQARLAEEQKGVSSTGVEDDFLSRVLKLHRADPESFSFQDVLVTCLTNIGAGSDTTSISLSATMYYLISSPDCLRKLRQELESARETSPQLSFSELQKLPYLQACIKEALRMHPATGLPLGRVVPKGGAEIAHTFFPAGTVVGINTWVAHRNRSIFGEDADTFRPERWLEADKDKMSKMESYYMPFGSGARTCIGKNISVLEMTKLVPVLVTEFDISMVRPGRQLRTENDWFVKQVDFECTIERRPRHA